MAEVVGLEPTRRFRHADQKNDNKQRPKDDPLEEGALPIFVRFNVIAYIFLLWGFRKIKRHTL